MFMAHLICTDMGKPADEPVELDESHSKSSRKLPIDLGISITLYKTSKGRKIFNRVTLEMR